MMHRLRSYLFAVWFLAFCASQCIAANVRWTGAAQDVHGTWTIAVSGTWATGDTATLTLNNKSLTATVGSATSTSNVADIIARMVDAQSATEDLLGNETRNFGGEEIPEFTELDASASGSTITITTEEPGVSLTKADGNVAITRSEATAGDGALGAVTAGVAPTGKNWLSNAANYSGGAIPSDNDVLYIDTGDIGILYALTYFRDNNIDLDVITTNDFTGQIGLPQTNELDDDDSYTEYRQRYFQYRGGSKTLKIEQGIQGNANAGSLWIDLQDQAGVAITIRGDRGSGTVYLAGAHASTFTNSVEVAHGTVIIEPDDAPTATTKYAAFAVSIIGAPKNDPADPKVTYGRNARLAILGDCNITQHSGLLTIYASMLSGSDDCSLDVFGGTCRTFSTNGEQWDLFGGTLLPQGPDGVLSEINVHGGSLDFREAGFAKSVTHLTAHAGAAIYDPSGLCVDTIDLVGCRPSQLTLELPSNRKLDISANATP